MDKQLLISESLVKALIIYLAARPYGEVDQVIPALRSLQAAPLLPANEQSNV